MAADSQNATGRQRLEMPAGANAEKALSSVFIPGLIQPENVLRVLTGTMPSDFSIFCLQ